LKTIFKVFSLFAKESRIKIFYLYLLVAISGFSEVALVALLVPTISVLISDNNSFFNIIYLSDFFNSIPKLNLFLLTTLFIIFTGFLRFFVLKSQLYTAYNIGHELSKKLYDQICTSNRNFFLKSDRDNIITTFSAKIDFFVTNGLLPTFFIFSASFMILMIAVISLIIAPLSFLIVILILGPSYFFVIILLKKRLLSKSHMIDQSIQGVNRTVIDTLDMYRELILGGNPKYFQDELNFSDQSFRYSKAYVQFYTTSPKFVLESLGMVIILIIAFYANFINSSLSATIALAVGLQRALPYVQQVYNSWGNIKGSEMTSINLIETFELVADNQDKSQINLLPVKNDKNIFSLLNCNVLKGNKTILKDISLNVKKNEKLAIVGQSGSGKSTLLDIISGLQNISKGSFTVSSPQKKKHTSINSWQSDIFYLGQKYPIGNMKIKHLITFPELNIDEERLKISLEYSQSNQIIDSLPMGIETPTSDAKNILSGGELQRIQISRIFYTRRNLLLLDECTSALDSHNSEIIIDKILSLKDKTVIFVTHDYNNISKFDGVFKLN
jgi:ATP-binding cassette subfamily B protein